MNAGRIYYYLLVKATNGCILAKHEISVFVDQGESELMTLVYEKMMEIQKIINCDKLIFEQYDN